MKKFILASYFIFLFNTQLFAGTYSFIFGVPDSITIGDGETGINLYGRIINNGDQPISMTSGWVLHTNPPWWSSNYWDYNVDYQAVTNINPNETRDFRLGIFKDDPLISRGSSFGHYFGMGSQYVKAPEDTWNTNKMAKLVTIVGGTSYVSSNYNYIQSSVFYTQDVIPEPATLLLLGLGLLGLVFRKKKFA